MNTSVLQSLTHSHIRGLDGIRAIAVFLMISYHSGVPYTPGGVGVMIFFVLSGFLITWLFLKENEKSGTISLSAFHKRRMLRIFPAYYAYLICLIVLLLIMSKDVLWPHALSAVFFLSNYYRAINGDPNTGFSHTWSLAIDLQFYLLWPVLFLRLKNNLRKMAMVLSLIIVGIWIYRLILFFIFNVDQSYFYVAFDTRLDGLGVGCLTAVLLKEFGNHRLWQQIVAKSWYPLITITILLISKYGAELNIHRYRDFMGLSVEPLLISILLVQIIVLIDHPQFNWLESSVMKYLGKISYSLFLYQQLTLMAVIKRMDAFHPSVQIIVAILVTIVMASASFYFIEKPFHKLKNQPFSLRGQLKEVFGFSKL